MLLQLFLFQLSTFHSFAIRNNYQSNLLKWNKISIRTFKTHMTSNSLIDSFPIVTLEKGKARLFQDGNPIVYGGAVKEIIGLPKIGDEVVVKDYMGNNIGRGIFNPISTYRVRLFARSYESLFTESFENILENRIQKAKDLRESLGLGSNLVDNIDIKTTVYRLVNGEGDRLGGLVIDVLGSTIVCQASAYWVETYKATILQLVSKVMGSEYKLIWRQAESRLKQDGFTDCDETNDVSDSDRSEIVLERNVKFVVYPESNGQKTGFFCDQRDNRYSLGLLAKNKEILDCYCYSGGFTLHAALNNAKSIIAVDSSTTAIDLVRENLKINNIDFNKINLIKADAVEYMKLMQSQGKYFDIIICDPPKLAPSRSSLEKAKNKYIKINSLAMSIIKSGMYI